MILTYMYACLRLVKYNEHIYCTTCFDTIVRTWLEQ